MIRATEIFKALADETRLRLVNILLKNELNVNEILKIMDMGQSRISRHLKILTDCSLIKCRKDGLWSFYSSEESGRGAEFIKTVNYIFKEEPIFQGDIKNTQAVISKRSEESARFFDSIASNWRQLKREIFGSTDINSAILEELEVTKTVVDLGCGTGDLLPRLTDKAENVIGVDRSSEMLNEAAELFKNPEISLRIGELEHLPLRDMEADAAVINLTMHHLPDPTQVLGEVQRILKPGSQFIISDLLSHNMESFREKFGDRWLGFNIEHLEDLLQKGGFEKKSFRKIELKKGLKAFILNCIRI